MKRIVSTLLIALLFVSLASCSRQAAEPTNPTTTTQESSTPTTIPQESSKPSGTSSETTMPEPEPYNPMDIFGEEFNPFGMDFPDNITVFEATFDKGSAKLEGKNPFTLHLTGSGNMFACVAYQADIAKLSEEEKENRINEYFETGFCEFTGKDGRVVTIRRADPNDDRYEFVEADGSHGQTGAGCVIDITYFVPGADLERYTTLIRDTYSIDAMNAISTYMDVETDYSECSIDVSLYKNVARTAVTYYVSEVEMVRHNIAANIKSDWWEWNGNQETWISYNDHLGYKLIMNADAGAITISQESRVPAKYLEGSLASLGFGFDEAGICGVYEDREPHYKSIAIAKPEWGAAPGEWNIELSDTDVNGYVLYMWYYADEGYWHVSLEKGNTAAKYKYNPNSELNDCHPDRKTVQQMFNDALGTENDGFYGASLAHFEQYAQDRFGVGIDELYAAPKE